MSSPSYITNPDTCQAELSKNICRAYNKLMFVIASVPADQKSLKLMDGAGGKVSVADLISYQIGWGKLLIGWYAVGVQGKNPEMPGSGFSTWDYVGLANHFYTTYQYDSSTRQALEFYNVVTQIVALVEQEYISGNLDKLGVWNWCTLPSGKQWPLSKWVQVNTVAPYKRAALLIKACWRA